MMKQYVRLLFVIMLLGQAARAQQQPQYTQYLMNPFILNPALAGIERYWDVKASYRQQWAGLQDAPVTAYLSAHGPLGAYADDQATPTGAAMGFNPRGKAYWTDYETPPSHPGVGMTVLSDVTGPLRRLAFNAAYAHHIGLAPKTSISLGVSLGLQTITLDADKLNFADPGDPSVTGIGLAERWKPDINAGVWLYSADLFAGVAVRNIIPQELTFDKGRLITEEERGKLVQHIFATAGYRLWLNEDISMTPSLMLKFISPLPPGLDINTKFQYRDRLWVGANYRHEDGFSAMLGVAVTSMLNIGYAYDYTASSLNFVSKGTHEITLGLLLHNRNGDYAPRQHW